MPKRRPGLQDVSDPRSVDLEEAVVTNDVRTTIFFIRSTVVLKTSLILIKRYRVSVIHSLVFALTA